jgi:hypothetical protein
MSAAEHYLEEQYGRRDHQCPKRRESEHRLEYHETGNKLSGQIEKEHE